jgi:hypothetical protein
MECLKYTLEYRLQFVCRAKDLILDVCSRIEALRICKKSQISTMMKQLLRKEIADRKIVARYIHKVLPPKYKRSYRSKRELISLDQDYYDIRTLTSARKKFRVVDDVLECQIRISPLRLSKKRNLELANLFFLVGLSGLRWMCILMIRDSFTLAWEMVHEPLLFFPLRCIGIKAVA